MSDRNQRERDRLREKRKDPAYLARQRSSRARQMRRVRLARECAGKCHDCDRPKAPGYSVCRVHLRLYQAKNWYKR